MRGSTLVAATPVRGDGSFRFPVELAEPGPVPRRVADGQLERRHRADPPDPPRVPRRQLRRRRAADASRRRSSPAEAGRVRVQVIRSGQVGFDRSFAGGARVSLGTHPIAETVARPADDRAAAGLRQRRARSCRATLRPPNLSSGTTSPAVTELARQLAALHYAVPSFSSTFSDDLVESVWAFQKVQGLDRTGAVDAAFWTSSRTRGSRTARYSEPADHIEVDKTHQVLYIVRGGQIAHDLPRRDRGHRRLLHARGPVCDLPEGDGMGPEPARRPARPDVLHRRLRDPRQPVGAARTRPRTAASGSRTS